MTRGFTKLISFIFYPAKALTRNFDDVNTSKQVVKEGATRVPTFYGAELYSYSFISRFITVSFSMMFAMVPGFAQLLSSFPTDIEDYVWLFSSIAILLGPALFLHYRSPGKTLTISPFCSGIYILARIILFGLAFSTLRDLPPGALVIIHWPHFILIFIGN